jgi:hypothetical protein
MEEKTSEHELDAKVEDYLNSLSLRAMNVGGRTAHAHDRDTSERERREYEEGRQRESRERERSEVGMDWTMHVSKSSGQPYWFNRLTGMNMYPCATTYCYICVLIYYILLHMCPHITAQRCAAGSPTAVTILQTYMCVLQCCICVVKLLSN